jgi:hypothetical protein
MCFWCVRSWASGEKTRQDEGIHIHKKNKGYKSESENTEGVRKRMKKNGDCRLNKCMVLHNKKA